MAKGPTVIGVLTESAPPSWWQANRHKVLLVTGLLIGYYIGTHTADATSQSPDRPRPTHTAPASPSPAPHTTGPRNTFGLAA